MNDIINIVLLHFMAFVCAMIGFVYSDVLTEPNMVFHSLYKFLERKIGNYKFLFHPVIHCFRCVSGQLAFWTFFVLNFYADILHFDSIANGVFLSVKALFIHAYYICLTIYISWLLSKKYRN